ncbi:contractile injection system protein, VgrG/Pvc8 family [Pseudovibrio exalbescens]|uniref:phage late control D family protein n=1 Tax=Pseudovibrio exalbescens TaxID=197461 RepID=UPI002365E875|nr:contractile injection system protein, VgrG/Pvc8 family [Pseudovibrio exalbescens]MDD7908644.1 contractile injection system protein, VgrG/Pvc8 family [Pseudovibrio exalbescens]
MDLREPFLSLLINGTEVAANLAPHLLEFAWTDHLHGAADEVAVTLRDDAGLWRGPLRPEHGDKVVASIGYVGFPPMPCGNFEVDVPEASGARLNDRVSFRATSAYFSEEQRTRKSKAFENTTLKKVISEIAMELGYAVSGKIEEIPFQYKRQRRERSLQFLRRLSEDYGYFFTIKDKQLVFHKRKELEDRAPVHLFDLVDGTSIIRWRAKDQTAQTFGKAKVSYHHSQKKKLITGEAEDPSVASGDTLTIDERVEDEEEAKKIAEARLAKANEDGLTASVILVGNPLLIAGQVVALGSTFGKYAALYLVHKAVHRIKRGSYTTELELKAIRKDGAVKKQDSATSNTSSASSTGLFSGPVQNLSRPAGETY